MKKKNLSYISLFMLTAALITGCSCNKQSNENVSNLVIKVGDKEYSAKELYNQLLETGTGANEAFAKVLRLVVESSIETTKNMQSAADLALESLEEEASNTALSTGTSKEDELKNLLEGKGYNSAEEMKADIIYQRKLTVLTENYWEENKATYYNDYVANRLPYLVRHTLVKFDDNTNANKIANNVIISQAEAKKLVDVIKRFENGDSFRYVAAEETDDSASAVNGGAYYIDNSYGTSFVDEFVYGTYAFDAYTTKVVENDVTKYVYGANQTKLSKLKGLSDTEAFANYYNNGFNFVDMDTVNMLNEVYNQTTLSEKDYFTINAVEKKVGENDEVTYSTASGNLNSTENYYARSIIFNRVFNKPGVSVIGYNTKAEADAAGAKNVVELKLSDTESKFILTDENKNPIYFVAARGNSNDIWLHFLTINVSALDDLENAKKFFSLETNDEDNYMTYIELMNTAGTDANERNLRNEIEGYIKSYVTKGTGSNIGEESILQYDMVKHYIAKNKIEFANKELETALKAYISNKNTLLETNLDNTISATWDKHTDKLASNMSDLVQLGIKPFECGVWVKSGTETRDNYYTALTTSDYLCRYVYGEGYQVQLSYYYESTGTSTNESFTKISSNKDNKLYFGESSTYKQYVTIGKDSAHIVLPTPEAKEGYEFQGWFLDKDFQKPVEYIDLSESRMSNQTVFFAKIKKIGATDITYKYVYEDGSKVEYDITNENLDNGQYQASGTNTIALDKAKIKSNYVECVKFLNAQGQEISEIALTEQGSEVEVTVVVKTKPTTLTYKFVDANGGDVEKPSAEQQNALTKSFTYNAGETNIVTLNLASFWEQGATSVATAIKVGRGEDKDDFAKATELTVSNGNVDLEINETDIGKELIIYVVAGGAA